jgi:cobalamin biosynthesis Mg chelatase CobN
MDFVAELARRWVELARLPNAEKRIALILANYPTRDGRIGNGVGLDTPAAALNILRALQAEGYPVPAPLPDSGTALIQQLLGGVTNDLDTSTCARASKAWPGRLPGDVQRAARGQPPGRAGTLGRAAIRCAAPGG